MSQAIVPAFKPVPLTVEDEILELVELVVGKSLHELVTVLHAAARAPDVQHIEAGAVGDGSGSELQERPAVLRCCVEALDLEPSQAVAFEDELPKWHIFQAVLVTV